MTTADIEKIHLPDVQYDKYQRPLEEGRVQKIATAFDPDAVGYPLVSMREDASLWCIDGQHRIKALLARGIQYFDCEVWFGLSYQDEARMWRTRNQFKRPSALSYFNAALEAKDARTIEIVRIARKAGWAIADDRQGGNGNWKTGIRAVGALQAAYTLDPDALLRTLVTVRTAWPGTVDAAASEMIKGGTRFFHRFAEDVNDTAMARRLATYVGGPVAFLAQAKYQTIYPRVEQRVEASLIGLYNKGRSRGLIDPTKNPLR